MTEQTTLRDTLASALESAEADPSNIQVTLPNDSGAADLDATTGAQVDDQGGAQPGSGQPRDPAGRFAASPGASPAAPAQQGQPRGAMPPPPPGPDELVRPTTWKGPYLETWDKIVSGQPVTPEEQKALLRYVGMQRENEYKSGVSTYRQEAERAKGLQEALTPFMPDLQKHGLEPSQWIRQLGTAHQTLVQGTPQQKLQMFAQLAKDYGVPLSVLTQATAQGGGGVDPGIMEVMQQVQALQGQLSEVRNWREQQIQDSVSAEISAMASNKEKYPHFDAVRGDMAQLLERNMATSWDEAYSKAVRLNDEVWNAEQARLTQAAAAAASKQAATQRARANNFGTRTSTPRGAAVTVEATDRRSLLSEQLDAAGGRI